MNKSGYNHFNSVQSYYAVDTWVMLFFFNSESDVDQFYFFKSIALQPKICNLKTNL